MADGKGELLQHLLSQSLMAQRLQGGGLLGLESIANAAGALSAQENGCKLARRRQQIALASRKSRAKRKRELVDLRGENERLRGEIAGLRKRLRECGAEAGEEEEELEEGVAKKQDKQEETASDSSSIETDANGFLVQDPRKSVAETLSTLSPEAEAERRKVLQFVESRLSAHLAQLKEDVASFFGSSLSDESKEMLRGLQAKVSS